MPARKLRCQWCRKQFYACRSDSKWCSVRCRGRSRTEDAKFAVPVIPKSDLIAHEALNIKGMSQGRLAKSIMDAAWGILLYQLKYKAESAGVWVVPVNPRGTSQRCSGCGEDVKKTLSQRVHSCPKCGLELGRDHNAALNILALGRSAVRDLPAESVHGTSTQVLPEIGIFRGRVFCFTCREERTTAPELRLTGGWPMCCGVRMLPGARL